jgi:iron complex outermembrane recepter protein
MRRLYFFWAPLFAFAFLVGTAAPKDAGSSPKLGPTPLPEFHEFRIAASDASEALTAFSTQSAAPLVYVVEHLVGVRTNEVRGRFTAREALERLVAGTTLLVFEDQLTGALIIKANPPSPKAPASLAPTRDPPPAKQTNPSDSGSMKKPNLFSTIATWLAAGSAAMAQTTAPAPATAREEVIELSPFEVRVEADTGYVAQNTLAGSRLRTQLKDVAAAISPMTAELLGDIASTNVLEASEYAINTRSETDDGRAAGPIADTYNNENRSFRIRGLPGAGRTVNFMPYFGEADAFNTERIEINRGPNSILYGIGSAAGIINVTTKQARTDRKAYSLSLRVDSWDGTRSVADANIPLVKDKLALRAIYLHGRDQSWRSAGHNDQDRLFLAGTWKIAAKTTLKAEFENLDQDRYVPRPFFGNDQTSTWDAAGQPTFRNFDRTLPAGAVGTPGNPFRDNATTAVGGVVEMRDGPYIVLDGLTSYAQDYRRFTRSEAPTGGTTRTDFERGRRNPEADLQANWSGGLWENKRYSFTLQHEVFSGLNAELAFAHQREDRDILDGGSAITGDPNEYFPDGTLKPVSKKYYHESTKAQRPGFNEFDYARVSLSYETQLGKLGQLRLAGMGDWRLTESKTEFRQEYLLNGPEATSGGAFHPDPENDQNRLYYRSYVDLAELENPNYRIAGPYDVSNGVTVRDPATGVLRKVYPHLINRGQGNWSDTEAISKMVVGQFYTLKNRLILTGGYRWDEFDRYSVPFIRDPAAVAPNRGPLIPVAPPQDPTFIFEGTTYTYGVVGHITPWLSGFYNYANSINPPGGGRVVSSDPTSTDPFDTNAPLRTGVTNDFGLKLSFFDERLFVTATRFATQAKNDSGFSGFGFVGGVQPIWQALRDSTLLSEQDRAVADAQFNNIATSSNYLYDSETKGYELEISGQILPGWSVSLNYSQSESVWSNVAKDNRTYIDYWKSPDRGALSWTNPAYAELSLTQSTTTPGPDYRPGGSQDFRAPADIIALSDFTLNTDTINERLVDNESGLFNNPFVFEGRRFIGDNKHNFNLRTRYDFTTGRLKGLTVGGGMRMRNDRVAGAVTDYTLPADIKAYTNKDNGRTVTASRLTKATDQALFDLQLTYRVKLFENKVNWTIQLNVNNLLDEDEFIVNNSHPSTGEPITYRYQDPRQFILTNTFSF